MNINLFLIHYFQNHISHTKKNPYTAPSNSIFKKLRSQTYIPIKRGNILIAGNFSASFLNTVTEDKLIGRRIIIVHVPNACRAVSWSEMVNNSMTFHFPLIKNDRRVYITHKLRYFITNISNPFPYKFIHIMGLRVKLLHKMRKP